MSNGSNGANVVASALAENTLKYWNVSRAWNNKPVVPYTVSEAIRVSNSVLYSNNPARPLARKMEGLLVDIIEHGVKKAKKRKKDSKPVKAQITVI